MSLDNGIMTCPICTNFFDVKDKEPKVLSCGHTICLKCIDLHHKEKYFHFESHVFVECLLCNSQTIVPPSGLSSLPINYQLLSKVHNQQFSTELDNHMMICLDCGKLEKKEEMFFCDDCITSTYGKNENGTIMYGSKQLVCSICAIRNHINRKHAILDYTDVKYDQEFEINMEETSKKMMEVQQKARQIAGSLDTTQYFGKRRIETFENAIEMIKRVDPSKKEEKDEMIEIMKQEMEKTRMALSSVSCQFIDTINQLTFSVRREPPVQSKIEFEKFDSNLLLSDGTSESSDISVDDWGNDYSYVSNRMSKVTMI